MTAPVVIVGGGLAAATAAVTLREEGYDGGLVLYGAEPHLPYERPALSKGYLAGTATAESLLVRPAEWYADHDVDVRTGCRIGRLDPAAHTVTSDAGELRYSRLLLATGATPRRLPMADDSGAPVAYLRTLEDSHRIRSAISPGARIALVGGGFLGLEVAATARSAGAEVTVIEAMSLPLVGVLGPEVAATFAALHRDHGVDLRVAARVSAIERSGDGALLRLGDGSTVAADLVVVGIGALPEVALAESAGLRVGDGVLVDDRLRTSAPHVLAAGDLARVDHPRLGPLRVEHWDTAITQGRVAGRALAGADAAWDGAPYFFTDQYDLGMEYAGHVGPAGYDRVALRGDVPGRAYRAYWLRDDVVVAAMQVNDWSASEGLRATVGMPAGEVVGRPEPA
jgi:NADPH-dependent 2,4-dienoyl-CoA reductase/sulfur reductase-like enzyme